MLIPLPEPESDDDLLQKRDYSIHGAHPFTLFERCNHELCGKPAIIYLLYLYSSINDADIDRLKYQLLFSRCNDCLKKPLPSLRSPRYITREEAVEFVITYKIMNS